MSNRHELDPSVTPQRRMAFIRAYAQLCRQHGLSLDYDTSPYGCGWMIAGPALPSTTAPAESADRLTLIEQVEMPEYCEVHRDYEPLREARQHEDKTRKDETEQRERAELARLQAKYRPKSMDELR